MEKKMRNFMTICVFFLLSVYFETKQSNNACLNDTHLYFQYVNIELNLNAQQFFADLQCSGCSWAFECNTSHSSP